MSENKPETIKEIVDEIFDDEELVKIKRQRDELLEAVEQGYEMIDTLAGLSSWDSRSEDEINEIMKMMLEAMGKAKGDGENDKN